MIPAAYENWCSKSTAYKEHIAECERSARDYEQADRHKEIPPVPCCPRCQGAINTLQAIERLANTPTRENLHEIRRLCRGRLWLSFNEGSPA